MSSSTGPATLDSTRLYRGVAGVLVVGSGVTAAVVLVSGGRPMLEAFGRVPPLALLGALALAVASWFGEALVFQSLAGLRGWRSFVAMIRVYVGGGFPGLVTPFGSGAIPGWIHALTREGLDGAEAAAVVAARAVLTAAFFVAVAGSGVAVAPLYFGAGSTAGWTGLAVLASVLVAAVIIVADPNGVAGAVSRLLRSRPLRRIAGPARSERLDAFSETIAVRAGLSAASLRSLVLERPLALAIATLGLLASRACLLAILPLLMGALGWRGPVAPVVLTVVGIWAVASGSPTPGGSGTAEAGLTAALSLQAPVSIAAAAAVLWRLTTFYFELLVGWFLFARYLSAGRARGPLG